MTWDHDLVHRVRARIVNDHQVPSASRVAAALRAEGAVLDDRALLDVVGAVRSELEGAGPLEPLLRDPQVSDVLVNGPDEVWVDRGGGLCRATVTFTDEDAVRRLAQRLSASAGRRLDTACPTVDARLAGGVRLHAVLPPISPAGTVLSLRVPRHRAFSLDELVACGTLTPPHAEILRDVVRARVAFLVTGGTGTGKTTLLSSLLGAVPAAERIVLVEDAGELLPAHPHVVRLQSRPANVEGAGAVGLRELVRQSLRMRPDRLVVGEVRGPEVIDLLAALNTGHEGGCGTIHANTPDAVPARLEALGLSGGLGRQALHSQVAAALRVVVHLTRGADGIRRVTDVAVLEQHQSGLVQVLPGLVRHPRGRVAEGEGYGRLVALLASGTGAPQPGAGHGRGG